MADIRLCSFKVSQAVSSTPVTTMRAILLKKKLLFHCVGYAFKASGATDFLSITVLCLHIIVPWAHIIYLLTTRRSSDCWDSVEEMLTLALTSKTDTRILQNTCDFVKRFGTMGLVAQIRRVGGGTPWTDLARKERQEEVQMLVVAPEELEDEGTASVVPGTLYGKMV